MVVTSLRIVPSADKRSDLLELLRSVQGPIQAHPDCRACRLYEEDGAEQSVLLWERWASRAAFHHHVRSPIFQRILAAIELSSQPPEVGVYEVSSAGGLEVIEELRQHAPSTPVN